MSKEKQIEEMACAMCGNEDICGRVGIEKCILYSAYQQQARRLYNIGYRKQSTILGVVSTIENYPEADVMSRKQMQQLFTEIEEAIEDAEIEYGTIFGIKIAIGCIKNKYLGEK